MSARPYQVAAIEALRSHVGAGRRRLLLVSPTGSGKSFMGALVVAGALANGGRVLWVVHLRELVSQAAIEFRRNGVTRLNVLRGDDERVDPTSPITVASIQTLARRDKPQATVVVLDEAHRSLADSYVKHVWEAYPDAVIIGLTATPCRGDGRPLGERYQALVQAATYSELIESGHVAEPLVYAARVEPDLSSARKVAGDWADDDVERIMSGLAGEILPTWREHAGNRSTIVFASGIDHSKDIVARFLGEGVAAEHLDGTTPSTERTDILSRLALGITKVVSNVGVLTEGFDMPSIRCAVIARPTLSRALHMQTAGRVLRPGDVQPVIIDHAGNCNRFGLPHMDVEWSLDGPAVTVAPKKPYRTCKKCWAYILVTAKECPHCGYVNPPMPKELPEERPAVMEQANPQSLERAKYISFVNLARSRGLKPGFAAVKWKEEYGRWPPWAWSEATRAQFAGDEDWQERLEDRQMQRIAKKEKPATMPVEEPEREGDWFE